MSRALLTVARRVRRPNAVLTQTRSSSHSPLGAATSARKPVTINTLQTLYRKNEPITMITAHDFPSAHVADHAGMDMVLVGDSLAMVALGMEDTSEVLMDEMLLHCKSVARATKAAFTVCTTPSWCDIMALTHQRSAIYLWAAMKSPLNRPWRPPSA